MRTNENRKPQNELQRVSLVENVESDVFGVSKMQYFTNIQRAYINGYLYKAGSKINYHGPFQTFLQVKDQNLIWRRVYQWRGFFNKNLIQGNVELTVYMKVKNQRLMLLQEGSQNIFIEQDQKIDIDSKIINFLYKNFGIDLKSQKSLPRFKYSYQE